LKNFFGDKPEESYNYGKIINEKQFDRITGYLSQGKVIYGGKANKTSLFIEPTLLTDVPENAPVMKEEIFGPVLPIISFTTVDEARSIIDKNPNPLAFYIFTSSRKKKKNGWKVLLSAEVVSIMQAGILLIIICLLADVARVVWGTIMDNTPLKHSVIKKRS